MRAILTYHSIDASGSPISVAADAFRRHLRTLRHARIRVVPLAELLRLSPDIEAVALTFDDGLASVADAAPVLEAEGWSATIFVVSGRVGGDNRWPGASPASVPVLPLLDWDALGRLADRGFEIGAHTRRHPRLTACGDAQLEEELEGAADDVTTRLGRRPCAFAYPYGDVNERVASAAARVYPLACTTTFRALRSAERPEQLPRLDAYYFRNRDWLALWGTGRFRSYLAARRILRAARQMVA
jgi:peptidoglycan/xylan/chitin deacetylase (PgdA/CDA1 family)